MEIPFGSPPDPAQQFAQQDCPASAKDDDRPGLPHQSVYELVQLRTWHARNSSNFAA
jgi:hypothetical protein